MLPNLDTSSSHDPFPQGALMTRETRSSSELQAIILQSLKVCPGFEDINEVMIQPREHCEGGTNWTLASVRPRVEGKVLRGARDTITYLQHSYELDQADIVLPRQMRRRA
jgi:hypothetical protein